jgi:hypothetical protein
MSLSEAEFWISFIAVLAALALIWRGRRGRRVGDHLHCSYCAHDLFGISSPRCPECGELIRYGRPRGRHVPHKRMLQCGLWLLVLAVLGLCTVIVNETQQVRWIEHQPLWYVLSCVRPSAVSPDGEAHLVELERRQRLGKLSADDSQRVIAMLLEYQADAKRPWSAALGRMIERFNEKKQVSDHQWTGYLANGLVASLDCPPVLAARQPAIGRLVVQGSRYGNHAQWGIVCVDQVQIDDLTVAPPATMSGELSSWNALRLPLAAPLQLKGGNHALTVRYTLSFSDGNTTFSRSHERRTSFVASDEVAPEEHAEEWLPTLEKYRFEPQKQDLRGLRKTGDLFSRNKRTQSRYFRIPSTGASTDDAEQPTPIELIDGN